MSRWPSLRAGSVLWLLAHECRLFFYEMGDDKSGTKAKRGMPYMGMGVLICLVLAIHLAAWKMLANLPPLTSEPAPMIIMGSGAALLVAFSLMLSLALNRSVKALFERGDLDLLLSSPLPAKTIFSVRLAGIVFGVAILFLLFLSPFAHVGLLFGQVRWIGIYPTLISLAVIASSMAMLLTLSLVRMLGVRRTLIVAQLLGALTGAGVFILTQIFGGIGDRFRSQINAHLLPLFQHGGALDEQSLIWIPARALFGSPSELLIFAALGLACFWLTARYTHEFFVRGVQQAGAVVRNTSASTLASNARKNRNSAAATNTVFRAGATQNLIFKEWRSIMRDPQLISQIALQLLYLMPMFFLVFKGNAVLSGVAAGITFLAASLAGSLIWIIIAAEDAPDLLHASPVPRKTIRNAKLTAAVLPVFALILPVLGYLLLQTPALALLMLLAVTAAMASASLIHLWLAKPGTRDKFNKRGSAQIGANLLEALSGFSWAAVVYLGMSFGLWAFAPVGTALLLLGVAWLFRIERKAAN